MFVALNTEDGTRVTSIDPEWDHRVEALRELARMGQVVCPGCKQSLWLRTGMRRRHFAHRSLSNCPLEDQSQAVWETKAQLYLWLKTKYPGQVYLDQPVGLPSFDKVPDLLVEPKPGLKFVYWVFDRQQRDREIYHQYRSFDGVRVHFIHTHSAISEEDSHSMVLTASQRDFIRRSDFDAAAGSRNGGHLHFFNEETSTISICRGLRCVHEPNLYHWEARREGLLSTALISPSSGEIVLQPDVEARHEWRHKKESDRKPEPVVVPVIQPAVKHPQVNPPEEKAATPSPEPATASSAELRIQAAPPEEAQEEPEPEQPGILSGPFKCEDCGEMTTEWSSARAALGTCVCRECTRKRRERMLGKLGDGGAFKKWQMDQKG